MKKNWWSPNEPVWRMPGALLTLDKIRWGWFPIDGITPIVGSSKHHQWLAVGKGSRIWKNIGWVFANIRNHLGIDRDNWRDQRAFLLNFTASLLSQYRNQIVSIQVLPQRKTFCTLFVDANPQPVQAQRIIHSPRFEMHSACLNDSLLDFANGIRIPGEGLLMVAPPPKAEHEEEEPFWTNLTVVRKIHGGMTNTEKWFFMAYAKDADRIKRLGTVPILESFFDQHEMIQSAPLVSFCGISPNGRILTSHCFSLHPESGMLLDVRQSRPTLEHHCRSAPHNESGLHRIVYRERGGG